MRLKRIASLAAGLFLLGLAGTGLFLAWDRHASQAAPAESAEPKEKLDADTISRASGAKATTTPDGVVRIGWPRTDVTVEVDGMPLKPFAGLGSWAAFTSAKHGAMVMGDTVVFQDEVTPAMDAAFA